MTLPNPLLSQPTKALVSTTSEFPAAIFVYLFTGNELIGAWAVHHPASKNVEDWRADFDKAVEAIEAEAAADGDPENWTAVDVQHKMIEAGWVIQQITPDPAKVNPKP